MPTTAAKLAPATDEADLWTERLLVDGWCVIPDLVSRALVKGIWTDLAERFEHTPFCDGDFYGRRTKRFGGVLKRARGARRLVMHPLILDVVGRVLGPYTDRLQLNLTQGLQIHPGETAQPPHRDEDMWGGPKGQMEYLVNVMWPFSDYTAANGTTRIYPGSHRDRSEAVLDRLPVAAEMQAGSALLFLGSTLHGGGANRSPAPRTGMVVSYCLGWLKPYENQWLVYPPPVARAFDPELARLVGYQQHRPNLGNYEGQCPSVLLRGDLPDHLAATDELRPDQAMAAANWRKAASDPFHEETSQA